MEDHQGLGLLICLSRHQLVCYFEHVQCCIVLKIYMSVQFNIVLYLGHCTRKPTICICENKDADQLTAKMISAYVFASRIVQFLYFLNLHNFHLLTIFCDCTGRFVLDLVGTHIVGFLTHMLICFEYWALPESQIYLLRYG